MKSSKVVSPPSDLIVMGRLNRPYGIRGWIRVEVYTEYLDSLLEFSSWWIQKPNAKNAAARSAELWQQVNVAEGKIYQDGLVVKFADVNNPEEAQLWGRSSVAVSRADFPESERDSVYWVDLIGMSVLDSHGELFGVVDHLFETGAHDVLCVKGTRGEQLIPYTEPFLKSVDTQARQIVVDWEWTDYS